MENFLIVEVPHQGAKRLTRMANETDFINFVSEKEGFYYLVHTMRDALDCYGEHNDIPREWLEILYRHGKLIEIGNNIECDLFIPGTEPSEFDAAQRALFDDLYQGYILSEEEAQEI